MEGLGLGFDDFASASVKQKKYANRRSMDPVLFRKGADPEITLVTEGVPTPGQIKYLRHFMANQYGDVSFQILSAVQFQPKQVDLKTNVTDFYVNNRINFKDYLKPWSKVVPIGRALYSFTETSDLDARSFYDFVFNKTWFFVPEYKAFVFPVDMIDKLVQHNGELIDDFPFYFLKKQLDMAVKFNNAPRRIAPMKRVEVDDFRRFVHEHRDEKEVAWDIETTDLDYFAGQIICLTMSFDGKTGYWIDWRKVDTDLLSDFMRDKFQIGANLKFDIKYLVHNGVQREALHVDYDIWPGGHVLNEMRPNGLKAQSYIYTWHGGYENKLEEYKKFNPKAAKNYGRIPRHILFDYAVDDSIVTYKIYQAHQKELDRIDREFPMDNGWSLRRYLYDVVLPAHNVFIDVELEGMPINVDKLREEGRRLQAEIMEARQEVYRVLGVSPEEVNIDSGNQLGKLLESRGWEDYGRGKSGIYLTNDALLHKWGETHEEEVAALKRYRELNTLMKTFVGLEETGKGYWQYLKPDGRVHPNFGVAMTNSGRNWCRNPNLTNVPKRGSKAEIIRSFFAPPSKEFVISECDGAGLQLRIGASLSGDAQMRRIFTELSGDMHSITANQVFMREVDLDTFMRLKKEGDERAKYFRQKAKGSNFSLLFGSAAFAYAKNSLEQEWTFEETKRYIEENDLEERRSLLAYTLDYTKNESGDLVEKASPFEREENRKFSYYWAVAEDIRKKFFETYTGLEKWHESTIAFAEECGYSRSPFGAIRRLPELRYQGKDTSKGHIKNLQNISLNSPVQNYESVLISSTMVYVHRKMQEHGFRSRIIGNVHDSIVFFLHRSEIDQVVQWAKEKFVEDQSVHSGIPFVLEADISDYFEQDEYWGFGREIA